MRTLNPLPMVALLLALCSSISFAREIGQTQVFNYLPLTPIDSASTFSRTPASIDDKSDENWDVRSEEDYYLKKRLYYLDPQSGATCLGVEGQNQCLEP